MTTDPKLLKEFYDSDNFKQFQALSDKFEADKAKCLKNKTALYVVNHFCNMLPRNMDIDDEYADVYGPFLNSRSGKGSRITYCGHYAHY